MVSALWCVSGSMFSAATKPAQEGGRAYQDSTSIARPQLGNLEVDT